MTKEIIYGTIIFATLVGLLIGFSVIVILDSYTGKQRKKIFAVIIALTFVLIIQNLIELYCEPEAKVRMKEIAEE